MCNPLYVLPFVASLACPTGDFGGAPPAFNSDNRNAWVGVEAITSVGGQPSQFQLTDAEQELRTLAYYFIKPPHSRPAWKGVFGDYQRLPAPWRAKVVFDRTAYGRKMIDEPHRSQASSYQGLMEDVRNDLTMLDQFIPLAVKLNDMDIKRNKALGYIGDLSPRERADAQARMRENVLVVQWAQQCVEQRVSSYRWALERLVIMAPDRMAAQADALITGLAHRAASAWTTATPVAGQVLRVGG